jgi:hypothetical protein
MTGIGVPFFEHNYVVTLISSTDQKKYTQMHDNDLFFKSNHVTLIARTKQDIDIVLFTFYIPARGQRQAPPIAATCGSTSTSQI